MTDIPVIDISPFSLTDYKVASSDIKRRVAHLLVDALANVGFAYLKNTGISKQSIAEVNHVTELFFQSPVHEKAKFSEQKSIFGYVGVKGEILDSKGTRDYKEVFNVSGCLLPKVDDSQWPDNISPNFSSTIKAFMEQCKTFSYQIMEALAIGLEIEDESFFQRCHSLIHAEGNYTALRSLYYPPLPDELSPEQKRLGEHSDYGSFTLLFQDTVGGLQVENREGKFVDATPIDDTVLVNIGDALQFWTRGKLKSTKHRVEIPEEIIKRKTVRRSLVYFVLPNDDVRIDKHLKFKQTKVFSIDDKLSDDSIEPITFLTYLERKLSNSFESIQKLA